MGVLFCCYFFVFLLLKLVLFVCKRHNKRQQSRSDVKSLRGRLWYLPRMSFQSEEYHVIFVFVCYPIVIHFTEFARGILRVLGSIGTPDSMQAPLSKNALAEKKAGLEKKKRKAKLKVCMHASPLVFCFRFRSFARFTQILLCVKA